MNGLHLLIDGEADERKLASLETVSEILDELSDKLKFIKLSSPFLKNFSDGVTGFIIIAESHISIHTLNEGKFFLDVFCCKRNFDKKIVVDYLENKINARNINAKEIKRGI